MLFLMFTFLMIQLQSFNLLALVLSVVPMGLIGIIMALLLVGKPLGFVAILGNCALLGLIARNAVISIEQIQTERAQGLSAWMPWLRRANFASVRSRRSRRFSSPISGDLSPLISRQLGMGFLPLGEVVLNERLRLIRGVLQPICLQGLQMTGNLRTHCACCVD